MRHNKHDALAGGQCAEGEAADGDHHRLPMTRRLAKAFPRRVPGQMNKTEAAYAQFLDIQLKAGLVQAWWFERLTLKLADDCRYTPDFMVIGSDGVIELHETKGFMRDDARVKLKVAADMFPFRVKLIRRKGNLWSMEEIG